MLRLQISEGKGLGLFTSLKVEKGSILATVPANYLINDINIPGCKDRLSMVQCLLKLMHTEHHAWVDYVQSLPKTRLTTMWTQEELNLLGSSELALATRAKLHQLTIEYQELNMQCTFDEFVQVEAIVRSRSLQMGNQCFLAPFIDWCNHSNQPNARWELENDLKLISTCTIDESQEVFISYGEKSNAELMFSYGFAIENNVYDKIRFVLPLDFGSEEWVEWRRSRITRPFVFLWAPQENKWCSEQDYNNLCMAVLDPEIENLHSFIIQLRVVVLVRYLIANTIEEMDDSILYCRETKQLLQKIDDILSIDQEMLSSQKEVIAYLA